MHQATVSSISSKSVATIAQYRIAKLQGKKRSRLQQVQAPCMFSNDALATRHRRAAAARRRSTASDRRQRTAAAVCCLVVAAARLCDLICAGCVELGLDDGVLAHCFQHSKRAWKGVCWRICVKGNARGWRWRVLCGAMKAYWPTALTQHCWRLLSLHPHFVCCHSPGMRHSRKPPRMSSRWWRLSWGLCGLGTVWAFAWAGGT